MDSSVKSTTERVSKNLTTPSEKLYKAFLKEDNREKKLKILDYLDESHPLWSLLEKKELLYSKILPVSKKIFGNHKALTESEHFEYFKEWSSLNKQIFKCENEISNVLINIDKQLRYLLEKEEKDTRKNCNIFSRLYYYFFPEQYEKI